MKREEDARVIFLFCLPWIRNEWNNLLCISLSNRIMAPALIAARQSPSFVRFPFLLPGRTIEQYFLKGWVEEISIIMSFRTSFRAFCLPLYLQIPASDWLTLQSLFILHVHCFYLNSFHYRLFFRWWHLKYQLVNIGIIPQLVEINQRPNLLLWHAESLNNNPFSIFPLFSSPYSLSYPTQFQKLVG